MKNPNGYGTTFRLTGNRRKPWVARITTGWTTGIAKQGKHKGKEVPKQEYQVLGYFKEKPDALAALAMHRINPVSPKANITLETLYKEWSKTKYQQISKQTINNYKAAWIRLVPLSNMEIREIRTAHLQGIIDQCHKANMSRSSLQKIKAVSAMLWGYAMENDILNKNYATFLKFPKQEKTTKERFSDLEIKKLFDNLDSWTSTVLIMIYTGMRISEMLNLTKFNVDLEREVITGGIKTEAGRDRVIPIHPKILPFVKEWYPRNGETLICDEKGKSFSAKRYREKCYYPALEKAKVRKLVPHACRHTFGSLMAEAGVDTLSIQKIIGHSDYSTTANIYTHVEIEHLKKAIKKI